MPAFYDFFRKIKLMPNNVNIEADSTTDTATFVAGTNLQFTIDDALITNPNTTDQVTIDAADFSAYVPLGTTKIRLEKTLGVTTSTVDEIEFYPDPTSPILITRNSDNKITIGASSPTLPFSQEQIEDLSAALLTNGTHTELTVTYQDTTSLPSVFTQDATDGAGINAVFNISIINNTYVASINNGGSGFSAGNTVTVYGTQFPGGANPTNNVTITVGTVDGSGVIQTISAVSGTPIVSDNIDLAVTSTLENVTGRGASSTNAITISNATGSSDTSTGALKLTAGGLAVFENANVGGYVKATTLQSTQTTGTAPLTVASTTMVSNLQAETASKWHTARTVTFTGDVTGSFSIDGSADVTSVALTVGSDKVALGTDTTGNYVATGATSGNGISGSTSSEGATFTVSSNATALNTAETIVFRDASGNFSAGVISATRLAGAISGGGTGQGSNAVKIGWGGSQLLLEVDVTDFGATWPIAVNGGVTAGAVSASSTLSIGTSTLEAISVNPAALNGATTLDCKTNSVFYYSSNATGNWTLNFRGDGSTTLNSFMTNGQSVTVVLLAQQGATAYYPTSFSIDGSAVTPKWLGGSAPTGGNASSIDSYSFTIIKTAASTYTVIASQARFA